MNDNKSIVLTESLCYPYLLSIVRSTDLGIRTLMHNIEINIEPGGGYIKYYIICLIAIMFYMMIHSVFGSPCIFTIVLHHY